MLIIPQCRFCNQETKTCSIRNDLKGRLKKGGVTENVRYECNKWKDYYLFKQFDTIQFRFLIRNDNPDRNGWGYSDKVITGMVVDRTDRRPIYIVKIDQEQLDLISSTESPYAQQARPVTTGIYPDEKETGFFLIPVRERFVLIRPNINNKT